MDAAGGVTRAYYSRVTTSTQIEVKARLDAGEMVPFAVVTDEQTQGRGRLDRRWVAPPGSSVLMTMAIARPPVSSTVPLLAGVVVAEVLRALGAGVRLKWPNDLVFESVSGLRKVGGIIAEVHGEAVLLGIGINVVMTVDELPTPEATCLAMEGVLVDREQLIADIMLGLVQLQQATLEDYRRLCCTLGSEVRVQQLDGAAILGFALAIDDDGALVVQSAGGAMRVTSGDVARVRGAVGR